MRARIKHPLDYLLGVNLKKSKRGSQSSLGATLEFYCTWMPPLSLVETQRSTGDLQGT